jgi:hypothetical protein
MSFMDRPLLILMDVPITESVGARAMPITDTALKFRGIVSETEGKFCRVYSKEATKRPAEKKSSIATTTSPSPGQPGAIEPPGASERGPKYEKVESSVDCFAHPLWLVAGATHAPHHPTPEWALSSITAEFCGNGGSASLDITTAGRASSPPAPAGPR